MSEALKQSDLSEDYKKIQLGPKPVKIPSKWEVRKLDELTNNSGNYGANVSAVEYDPEKPRYIRITDIGDDGFLKDNDRKSISRNDAEGYYISAGDLLFARTGATAGKSYLCREDEIDAAYAGYLICFEVDESQVNPEFLAQFVQSKLYDDWVDRITRHGAQQNVNAGEYRSLDVLYPPLPEQCRITEILLTVDNQIRQTDEIIKKTKELKRGLMQDLLIRGVGNSEYKSRHLGPQKLDIPHNWKKDRLGDVTEIITRGKQPSYVEEGGVPVLNQSCIYWDGFHADELKRLDEEVAEGWKDKYWVKKGDVLINSTGKGTLGRAVEWTKESNTHVLDSHITRVHPDTSVLDPTYFRFYLESNHGQKMLYAFCVAGSTGQIELSKTDLQTMPILLPPLEEQELISEAFLRVKEKLQREQQTKLELQQFKRGLMQDLLTGKVRVDAEN